MDPFLGEIRVFGFNFPPTGWALCDGQLTSISQNTALFSLLGTLYGGDGKSTFGLPNFQGALAISQGQSSGTSVYYPGESSGEQAVTLDNGSMASHGHALNVSTRPAKARQPGGELLAVGVGAAMYNTVQQPTTTLDPVNAVGMAGGNMPHNNMMPYLTLSFCIALRGIFPQRPGPTEHMVLAVREPGGDLEVSDRETEVARQPHEAGYLRFGPEEQGAEERGPDE